jgi:hypothetical protein
LKALLSVLGPFGVQPESPALDIKINYLKLLSLLTVKDRWFYLSPSDPQ